MAPFIVQAVYHGCAVFSGSLTFLPRQGEIIVVGKDTFVVKYVQYKILEGSHQTPVTLFLERRM